MGDLGAVPPDLGAGSLVVRLRVGVVGVLVEEDPLGVLGVQALGEADGPVRTFGAG